MVYNEKIKDGIVLPFEVRLVLVKYFERPDQADTYPLILALFWDPPKYLLKKLKQNQTKLREFFYL